MERNRWLILLLLATVASLVALAPVAASAETAPAGPSAAGPFELEEEEFGEGESGFDSDLGYQGGEGNEHDVCESDDEAAEEACEEKLEEREEEEAEAEECRLESAEATVAAVPGRDRLRLTVRYRAFEPSAVTVALGLRGSRGSLELGTDTARFGRTGTLHSERTLSAAQMARALAAKEFTVDLHAINTPGSCGDAFERRLSAREDTGSALRWSDPSATRRAKASRAGR